MFNIESIMIILYFALVSTVTTEILAFHMNLLASIEYSLNPGRQDIINKVTKV